MRTVLIVDDEKYIRQIYKKVINAASSTVFRVLESRDAIDATECILMQEVDLILLDIRMPGIKGGQLFKIIREYRPNIKVIVASVYPIEEQKKIIPQAYDYYDKSEGPVSLLDKVVHAFAN